MAAPGPRFSWQPVMAALLALTVLFNPILAMINTSVFPITNTMVALTQATLVGGAAVIGAVRRDRIPIRWIVLAIVLLIGNALVSMGRGDFNPKYVADVLTIPAFICLGTRMKARWLLATVVLLQVMLALVGMWELEFPDGFTSVFDPRTYYINTRGLTDRDFWAGGDFYVSAVRSQGRLLLDGYGFHRGSSLFLEPVSLGNWTILVTVVLIAFWRELAIWERAVLIAGNVICLAVCDGRLALVTTLALPVILPLLRMVPSKLSFFTPLIFGAVAVLIDRLGYLTEHGDTFSGRIRFSLDVMYRTPLEELLGQSAIEPSWVDAGFSYLIGSQSLLVVLILWLALTLSDIGENGAGRQFKFGMTIFFTLCLSVSYSMLSVKVVGVLWACYGLLYARAHATMRRSSWSIRRGDGG